MANEATVRIGLTIRKDNFHFQNQPQAFVADVASGKGPTPGALSIPTTGELVSLVELDTPGFCIITNTDSTNFVSWGIYDDSVNKSYLIGDILPGHSAMFMLHRWFGQDYAATGTGTGTPSARMFLKADTAAVVVKVEAFER